MFKKYDLNDLEYIDYHLPIQVSSNKDSGIVMMKTMVVTIAPRAAKSASPPNRYVSIDELS